MNLIDKTQYDPSTIEKVERLFYLLESFQKHPFLKDHFALFGGTAINLLMFDVPRLSVDIDISMIGFESVEELQQCRSQFEDSIIKVARFDGYDVRPGVAGHAGRTITLNYSGKYGRDKIKIDSIYMNRVPLLEPNLSPSKMLPDINVPVFKNEELIAGKTKAFFDRVKIRDIYDLYNIWKFYDGKCPIYLHKIILFYSCMSSTFPFGFEERSNRFLHMENKIKEDLFPMIKIGESIPSLHELITTANEYIKSFVLPVNEQEEKFTAAFAEGEYHPELLFDNEKIVERAMRSPLARWKLKNIQKISR